MLALAAEARETAALTVGLDTAEAFLAPPACFCAAFFALYCSSSCLRESCAALTLLFSWSMFVRRGRCVLEHEPI